MSAAKKETMAQHTAYEVTTEGDVFSGSNWRGLGRRKLTPLPDEDGYLCVRMLVDGVRKKFRVHRLVAERFLPPRPEGHEVRHLNGDKTDNRAANLAWGTAAENAADRAAHGRTSSGLTHSMKVRRLASANARLIAAAPELLEALLALVRTSADDESARWHYSDGRRIEGFRDSCPLCLARAAIAKARGDA